MRDGIRWYQRCPISGHSALITHLPVTVLFGLVLEAEFQLPSGQGLEIGRQARISALTRRAGTAAAGAPRSPWQPCSYTGSGDFLRVWGRTTVRLHLSDRPGENGLS